jgi:hypothetical protein
VHADKGTTSPHQQQVELLLVQQGSMEQMTLHLRRHCDYRQQQESHDQKTCCHPLLAPILVVPKDNVWIVRVAEKELMSSTCTEHLVPCFMENNTIKQNTQ